MAGRVPFAVGVVESLILGRDVGRVGHHGMVVARFQDADKLGMVLGLVSVVQVVPAETPLGTGAVQQRVAARQVEVERRGVGQSRHAAGFHGHQQQPEAGDGHGVGIDVHAVDAVERPLHQVADAGPRLVPLPRSRIRRKLPSRKCPLPQAGSIMRKGT